MVKLEKVWIGNGFDDQPELRLDWSNDRHHAVVIHHPGGPDEVADAFRSLAMLVYKDQHLRTPNAELRREP